MLRAPRPPCLLLILSPCSTGPATLNALTGWQGLVQQSVSHAVANLLPRAAAAADAGAQCHPRCLVHGHCIDFYTVDSARSLPFLHWLCTGCAVCCMLITAGLCYDVEDSSNKPCPNGTLLLEMFVFTITHACHMLSLSFSISSRNRCFLAVCSALTTVPLSVHLASSPAHMAPT